MAVCTRCGQENPEGFRFCGSCGAELDSAQRTVREERKVVSVLFCDLVGYTATAQAADPEDVSGMLGAYHASVRTHLNLSEWCDPGVDAQGRRAARLQHRNPAAANAIWASVDRTITNQAPWVPLVNLINADLVSKRVGNYTSNPYWGVLIDQMWGK